MKPVLSVLSERGFIVLGMCRFRPESFERPGLVFMLLFGLLVVVVVGLGAEPIRFLAGFNCCY